ncbi:MAG: hypothetical protein ACLQIB_15225 [Isosphaeraceae bacterium]
MSDEDLRNRAKLSERRSHPLGGGYYWVPYPDRDSITWGVLSCHEMGFKAHDGHSDLWLGVVDRLATAWNKDASALRRLLRNHFYGLPRGRVTQPKRRSLIHHGNDAPRADWLEKVIRSFDLDSRAVKPMYDEHETMCAEDRLKVMEALGIAAGWVNVEN